MYKQNVAYEIVTDATWSNSSNESIRALEAATGEATISCSGLWTQPNQLLFQLAHAVFLIAFLSPDTTKGFVFMHGTLVLGFLLMSTWAWAVLCAPDMFGWSFCFVLINIVQLLHIMYRLRPIKFSIELEEVYTAIFQPLKFPRILFKKLVSSDYCTILTLHQGESYAKQDVTRADRLGLLVNGSVKVLSNGQFLHHIQEKQFLDSPEFESTTHGDERFHVTIQATMPCRYIFWQRQALEYLFAREPYIATVMGHIMSRDITNKLYALNEKVKAHRGGRVDLRLPSISSATLSGSRTLINRGILSSTTSHGDQSHGELSSYRSRSESDNEEADPDVSDGEEKALMYPNGAPLTCDGQQHMSSSSYSCSSR